VQRKLLLVPAAALTVALALGLQGAKAVAGPAYKVGDKIEDFAAKDANGKTIKLSQYRGKTVVLNFYALW